MTSKSDYTILRSLTSGTLYGGFSWDAPAFSNEHDRTYDFTHFAFEDLDYEIPKLTKVWDTPQMQFEEDVHPENDFPCSDSHVPVFSDRAVSSLRSLLEPNGEILPVKTKRGKYFAYQTQTLADGLLDSENTDGIKLKPNSKVFYDIDPKGYSFLPVQRDDLSIFRLREHPSRVLVTRVFRNAVEEAGLRGFKFEPI